MSRILYKLIDESSKFSTLLFYLCKNFYISQFSFIEKVYDKFIGELLPLLEAGASWEVSAFVSQIYLPSSLGSSYPVFFYFSNIPTSIFQCFLYSMPHYNPYQSQFHSTHIYNFFLII